MEMGGRSCVEAREKVFLPVGGKHSSLARGEHADGVLRARAVYESDGHLPAPLCPVIEFA